MADTKRLAETLAASKDPKFKNSKFLQFVSKMSRGEIILEDNQVQCGCACALAESLSMCISTCHASSLL